MLKTLPFDPAYVPNIFFGTTVMNGNGEDKGFTVKGADGMYYADHTGLPWDDEKVAYDTDSEAIYAIIRKHLC